MISESVNRYRRMGPHPSYESVAKQFQKCQTRSVNNLGFRDFEFRPFGFCFEFRASNFGIRLKTSFLLQLLHKPVIDQVFRFEAANLFVACSQKPYDVAHAVDSWIDSLFV
jgi:hypothetical protein